MNEEKISSYIDREAIAEETEFMVKNVKSVLNIIREVNETKVRLGGADTLKGTSAASEAMKKQMTDLITQNQRLTDSYDKLLKKVDELEKKAKKRSGPSSPSTPEPLDPGIVGNVKRKAKEDQGYTVDAKETIAELAEQANAVDIVSQSYDGLVLRLSKNKAEQYKLNMEVAKLKKLFAEGNITQEQLADGLAPLERALAGIRTENQALNRAIGNFNKEAQAATGSTNEFRAQLNILLQAYDSLSDEMKKSDIGVTMKKNIDAITEAVTEHEQGTGRFQRNVGNYMGAAKETIDGLKSYLEDIRRAIELTKQASQVKISAPSNPAGGNVRTPGVAPRTHDAGAARDLVRYGQAAKATAEQVETLTKQEEILSRVVESQVTGFASATAEAKSYEKALKAMEDAGLKDTIAFELLIKQTAELKDGVGDLKAEINALASDTRPFDLVAQGIAAIAHAYAVTASVMELVTGENEDVQKSIQRLVAIQNVANGIQEIANQLTERGTFLNKVYNWIVEGSAKAVQAHTAATKAQSVAMEAANAGAGRFTKGLIALRASLAILASAGIIIGINLILGALEKWRASIRDVRDVQKELNEQLLEQIRLQNEIDNLTRSDITTYFQDLKNKLALSQAYGESQQTILNNELALLKARQELSTTNFFNTNGFTALAKFRVELNETKEAYEDLVKTRKKNGVILDEDDFQKEFGLLQALLNLAKQKFADQQAIVNEYVNNNNAVTTKEAEIVKFRRDQARKDAGYALEMLKRKLQNQADYEKELSELEGRSDIARSESRSKSFDFERQIIEAQRDYDLAEYNISEAQKANIRDKANDDIKKASDKAYADILGITASFRQREKEILEDFSMPVELPVKKTYEELMELEEKAFERGKYYQDEIRDMKLRTLQIEENAKMKAAQTDEERQRIQGEYAYKRAKIEIDANKSVYESALAVAQAQLKLSQTADNKDEIAKLTARISELRKQIAELDGQTISLDTGESQRKMDDLVDKITKAGDKMKEVFDIVGTFISASIDRQKNAIQEQIDALEAQKQKEIEVVNASVQNEEEKAAAITIINARAQAQREALERRQRELDIERARFEKASSIARIVADTAAAVVAALGSKPWTTANIAKASLVGAMGAAQLAAAIATPIPKFKYGREGGPETLGIVGDGGRHEVMYSPDFSKAYLTPATDTLAHIPAGYGIAPSVEEFQKLIAGKAPNAIAEMKALPIINDNGELIRTMARQIGRLESAILGLPIHQTTLTDSGLNTSVKKGNKILNYIQNNVQRK